MLPGTAIPVDQDEDLERAVRGRGEGQVRPLERGARLKEGPKALRPSIGLEPAMGTSDSGALD